MCEAPKGAACHPMMGTREAPNTSYDPGLLRQLDFGFRDWMGDGLKQQFALPDPRAFIPIMRCLAYDHLWDGRGHEQSGLLGRNHHKEPGGDWRSGRRGFAPFGSACRAH